MTQNYAAYIRQHAAELSPIPTEHPARLASLAGIRAVLFDVYGTMLISGSGDVGTAAATNTATAAVESLHEAGVAGLTEQNGEHIVQLLEQHIHAEHDQLKQSGIDYPEIDIREIWQRTLTAATRQNIPVNIADLDIERFALAYEMRVNPTWPMPGLVRTLESLKKRGMVLGIVSNAQFYTPLMLEVLTDCSMTTLGFAPELCIWSYQHRHAKPSLFMYERALEQLRQHYQLMPSQVLYVGNDMRNDIMPTCKLGCQTALFAGDQRSLRLREDDPTCIGIVPSVVIHKLPQLPDVLG